MPEAATHPAIDPADLDLFTDDELAEMMSEPGPYAEYADGQDYDWFAEDVPDASDVALAGRDGQRAGALLKGSVVGGREVFATLCRSAVERLLADEDWRHATTLFDDDELAKVQASIAAVRANGDLLGRSRVRRLAEMGERRGQPVKFAEGFAAYDCPDCGGVAYNGDPARRVAYPRTTLCSGCGRRAAQSALTPAVERFSEPEDEDPFVAFDDDLPVLTPQAAADYFRTKVPALETLKAERYAPLFGRQAYSIAASADEVILARVKGVLQDAIQDGMTRQQAAERIDDILGSAGVSTTGTGYADTVYRTNAMDAYTQGQTAEYAHPDMQEAFPAWEYHAIPDERARPHHAARDGLLFSSGVTFHEVRGTGPEDLIACRCGFSPIHKRELEKRIQAGETIQE